MKRTRILTCVVLAGALLAAGGCAPKPDYGKDVLRWSKIAPLPAANGVAGAFAGVSQDAMIVAGGMSLVPGQGGHDPQEVWQDTIYLLSDPHGQWTTLSQKLPRPLANGVCQPVKDGMLCAGGGDANRHYADVFLLEWVDGRVKTTPLPPLPCPAAFACAAILGETVYVAGGRQQPDSPETLKTFWALDLSQEGKDLKWQELEPWPGPGRMSAVAGVQDGSLYLFGGVDLVRSKDGKPRRRFLTDAHRYTPGKGWHRMPDLPRPVAGAPWPAMTWAQSHVLVFGGENGVLPSRTGKHTIRRGFSRQVLGYNTRINQWQKMGCLHGDPGVMLHPPMATPAVYWRGRVLLPGGEIRPGVLTSQVLSAEPWESPEPWPPPKPPRQYRQY